MMVGHNSDFDVDDTRLAKHEEYIETVLKWLSSIFDTRDIG